MKRWFTSDQHFFHDNIIHYCDRPFKNSDDMNVAIVKNYNRIVGKDDVVFFLGDIGFGNTNNRLIDILHKLNGKKNLVIGNHDKYGVKTYYKAGFSAVVDYAEIKLGKRTVTLGHYPKRTFKELIRLFWIYWKNPRSIKQPIHQRLNRLKKEWRNHRRPTSNWHICGHVHEAWKVNNNNINVCVDQWGFKPVCEHTIINLINKQENS